jgi:hypothetical protein
MLPSVKLQIKFTKARPSFYLMKKTADSKTTFKFFDTYLLVRRVHPKPAILSAQTMALCKGILTRHNLPRVELKTLHSQPDRYPCL